MDPTVNQFYVCRELRCQIPVIHFQPEQPGVTLRGTEVKPKLDRFLQRRYGDSIPESWYHRLRRNGGGALDYQMRFFPIGEQKVVKPHRVFFGNMGDGPWKMQIDGDCRVEILCFIPELRELIEQSIDEFFAVTNFGAMSGKGFGSYVTDRVLAMTPEEIGAMLRRETGAKECFAFGYYKDGYRKTKNGEIPCRAWEFVMDDVQRIYSAIKQKFLLRYFRVGAACEKLLGNEKTRLQELGISPALSNAYERHLREEYRYVRALLGQCDQMLFLTALDENYRPRRDADGRTLRQTVDISHVVEDEEQKLERYPSPILFKFIETKLYMVARRMDERIFDQEFLFTNGEKSTVLRTPSQSEFDIDDFIAWFTKVYRSFNKNRNYVPGVYDPDRKYRTAGSRAIWKIAKGESEE